ncbi:hypothetical protein ACFSM5_04590 [Lacibacterium aquatile]|uniref:Outer membrane lipoprotein SlyB n=1 Tax=Lacibacterium aquatile TaxID=1168082 RepID=A0ABW5DQE4_9PROT
MVSWKQGLGKRASVLTASGKSTTVKRLLLLTAMPLALAACSSNGARSNMYSMEAAQKVSLVERGQVLSVRKVSVTGNNSQVGTLTGVGAGAVGGSAVGGDWRSNALGAIGGAVIGGIGGAAVDSVVNEQVGYEYLFQVDGGKLQSLTQVDTEPLPVGQRVLLIQGPPARLIVDTLGLPPKAAAETVTAPPPAPVPAVAPAAQSFTVTVTPVAPAQGVPAPVVPASVTPAPAAVSAPSAPTPVVEAPLAPPSAVTAVPETPAATTVTAEPLPPPAPVTPAPAAPEIEPSALEAGPLEIPPPPLTP